MSNTDRERTDVECTNALRQAATELGESPSKAQYEELGLTPAASTIIRVCGGWNAAKRQAGLATSASTGSRVAERPEDVELPAGTEWADLSANQRWYYRHRETDSIEKRQRRTDLRAWLHEQKTAAACERCGESSPDCLEFHHPPGVDKRMDVGTMVSHGHSRASIREEIAKCDVLCSNCHRRTHQAVDDAVTDTRIRADVRAGHALPAASSYTKARYLRAWTTAYKRAVGCNRCGVTDARCLEFHHRDASTKVAGVGEMISDSYPVDAVLTEVEKCDVLCANCHREEHYETPDSVTANE
ncbi:homing endonuclease associated repeat-containing protein [Halorarius litoreus]|uniref:homing endonuclease associated repeat-containing protein n=1 Tax=Halorarius litoreus TaxID=2962676 RepID=UPI0020CD2D1F|nr:hypothetical protein [Halorarius litoreus]